MRILYICAIFCLLPPCLLDLTFLGCWYYYFVNRTITDDQSYSYSSIAVFCFFVDDYPRIALMDSSCPYSSKYWHVLFNVWPWGQTYIGHSKYWESMGYEAFQQSYFGDCSWRVRNYILLSSIHCWTSIAQYSSQDIQISIKVMESFSVWARKKGSWANTWKSTWWYFLCIRLLGVCGFSHAEHGCIRFIRCFCGGLGVLYTLLVGWVGLLLFSTGNWLPSLVLWSCTLDFADYW